MVNPLRDTAREGWTCPECGELVNECWCGYVPVLEDVEIYWPYQGKGKSSDDRPKERPRRERAGSR